jgi:Tripartite tricarboxylate transporter TctB family
MKTLDKTSSLFWLLVSIVVFAESVRLGVGTLQNPGRGFMTLGASGILGILSLVLFLQTALRKETSEAKPFFAGNFPKRIVFVLVALVIYSRVMPALGYLISTFLLMAFLFWILERKRIPLVLASSLAATLVTYFVFSKWLNCQFPEGLLGL